MAERTELRRRADRLDNAWACFLAGQTDGDAFVAAYDWREEGYALAEKAVLQADPEAFIEGGVDGADQGARDLVAAAAWFRMGELVGERRIAA